MRTLEKRSGDELIKIIKYKNLKHEDLIILSFQRDKTAFALKFPFWGSEQIVLPLELGKIQHEYTQSLYL